MTLSESGQWFVKALTVWTITFADIFDIFYPFVCIIGKEPADWQLVLEPFSSWMLNQAKTLPSDGVSLMDSEPN